MDRPVTSRLRLVPHDPGHLRALIEGPNVYARASGMTPAKGLRDFVVSADVSAEWMADLQSAIGADPWRYGFAVVENESGQVIGSAGFVGPPNPTGEVEIAYGIVPDFQGNGFATEAAQALIDFAYADTRTRMICAHTLPTRNASTRVLEKCGFHQAGKIHHPTDGLIWRWELDRPPKM